MKHKMFGTTVCDIDDLFSNHFIRDNPDAFPQMDRKWFADGYPTQMVCVKIAKNHSWSITASQVDYENKTFHYNVMTGPHSSEVRSVSYKDICKEYKWKSFEFKMNGQMIVPVEN